MTDPAVEAAQRAADVFAGWIPPFEYDDALDGARQALRPIRELYEEQPGNADESAELWVFLNKLAPLIFTTEELER